MVPVSALPPVRRVAVRACPSEHSSLPGGARAAEPDGGRGTHGVRPGYSRGTHGAVKSPRVGPFVGSQFRQSMHPPLSATHTHTHTCTHAYTRTTHHTHTHTHAHAHTHTHRHTHTHTHTATHTHTHTTHTHTHTTHHTHTHTHTIHTQQPGTPGVLPGYSQGTHECAAGTSAAHPTRATVGAAAPKPSGPSRPHSYPSYPPASLEYPSSSRAFRGAAIHPWSAPRCGEGRVSTRRVPRSPPRSSRGSSSLWCP
jgi:hypothetical protein